MIPPSESAPTVYVALQQFCEYDERPRQVLIDAGVAVRQNMLGHRLRREELLRELDGVEAVLAGVEPYDAQLLEALPKLRCISRCGAGADSIDVQAATRRQIAVFTTPDETVEAVAQMTVAMALALARNLPLHLADIRAGRWRKHTGSVLGEWTIGLIGFGRVGRAVERVLRAFGPRVLVTDPAVPPAELPPGVEWQPLPSLLAQSDLVSLHAAGRQDEGPLLGQHEFTLIKKGSRVINTARGFLIDEQALHAALVSGHLASAALDVYHEEPYVGPLATLPQVLCTPHVATLTKTSRSAMELRSAQQIVEFFKRQGPDA